MTLEFSEKEKQAISHWSKVDEWEYEELDRRIRLVMHDGVSFIRALGKVLARAERPESPVGVDPRKKELLAKVVELRDKMLKEFNEHQEKKAGIIK